MCVCVCVNAAAQPPFYALTHGPQVFANKYWQRCHTAGPNGTMYLNPELLFDFCGGKRFSLSYLSLSLFEQRNQGTNITNVRSDHNDLYLLGTHDCPVGNECLVTVDYNRTTTAVNSYGFDNILISFLTITTICSLEGWSDLM